MASSKDKNPGTYILVLSLQTAQTISVGALGPLTFAKGFYLYFGSALGGLEARVARHARKEKRIRWHIDYLLCAAELVEVWLISSSEHLECAWAKAGLSLEGSKITVRRFGSSDCDCPTHLVYLERRPALAEFVHVLEEHSKTFPFPKLLSAEVFE